MATVTATLKEQKEAFVTGHGGTTPSEVMLVCLSAPVGIFLYNEIRHLLLLAGGAGFIPVKAGLVAAESLVLLLPMAICQTDLLHPIGVTVLCAESLLGLSLLASRLRSAGGPPGRAPSADRCGGSGPEPADPRPDLLPFLTSYRSAVSYLTFVAVLAVDFRVFPRRFAKTEASGYGLMDLGAGSFVVSGGLVSRYARRCARVGSVSAGGEEAAARPGGGGEVGRALVRAAPLAVLGVARLVANKGVEYQEHASEYGEHWNFFFTLAAVGVLSSVLRGGRPGVTAARRAFPVVSLSIYQCALSLFGVQDFIENGSRRCDIDRGKLCHFFAANREGILGSVGYLSMYLFSEELAGYCIWSCRNMQCSGNAGTDGGKWSRLTDSAVYFQQGRRLLFASWVLWSLHWLLGSLHVPVSRRSTNATFIIWTMAHNVTLIFLIWAAFFVAEIGALVRSSPSPIFSAVNRHGLLVFLLANLMTGVVNLTMNTLEASDTEALMVIFLYLCMVGTMALLLDWALQGKRKQH